MKVYAACYTDCTYEYSPSIFSLHETRSGAEVAIAKSKQQSYQSYKEQQEYYPTERAWNPEYGSLCEKWEIKEMEVKK